MEFYNFCIQNVYGICPSVAESGEVDHGRADDRGTGDEGPCDGPEALENHTDRQPERYTWSKSTKTFGIHTESLGISIISNDFTLNPNYFVSTPLGLAAEGAAGACRTLVY